MKATIEAYQEIGKKIHERSRHILKVIEQVTAICLDNWDIDDIETASSWRPSEASFMRTDLVSINLKLFTHGDEDHMTIYIDRTVFNIGDDLDVLQWYKNMCDEAMADRERLEKTKREREAEAAVAERRRQFLKLKTEFEPAT